MDRASQVKSQALTDTKILKTAIVDSFVKLNPRTMIKNPVMFVVEVGALLTSIQLVRDALHHSGEFGFGLQITLWLWFTVLFANFAEAMAEGRGKAQADTLRKARAETDARRLRPDGCTEVVPSSKLRSGDQVLNIQHRSKVLRKHRAILMRHAREQLRRNTSRQVFRLARLRCCRQFGPLSSVLLDKHTQGTKLHAPLKLNIDQFKVV